jgi:putative methionine-R-sulfoxide reductase with GAF domain
VLDLDSPHLNGFSRAEADLLAALVRDVFGSARIEW